MYLANILNSEIKDFNHLRETIRYYDIQKELEDRVHGDYYSNVSDIRYELQSVILDLEMISGDIPEEIILNVYKEICLRLELFEEETFGGQYNYDKVINTKKIEGNDIKSFSEKYVELLYSQYEKLCDNLKNEARELYRFKCDIIDKFSNIMSNRVLVS